MKVIIVLSFLATTMAAPQFYRGFAPLPVPIQPVPQYQPQPRQQPFVPIVSESNEINPDGSFSYSYVSGDGQQQQAQGYLKNAGYKDQEAEVIQGSYSYTAPDGSPISVSYIADENGFRAEGAHLPTPPPVPEAIQRALVLIEQAQGRASPSPAGQYQPYRG